MTELINSYLETAMILKGRICELSEKLKTERDIDTINSLTARKQLLEEERYDLLAAAAQMHEYIKTEKAASGDC